MIIYKLIVIVLLLVILQNTDNILCNKRNVVNCEQIRTLKTTVVFWKQETIHVSSGKIEENHKRVQTGCLKRISQGCVSLALQIY